MGHRHPPDGLGIGRSILVIEEYGGMRTVLYRNGDRRWGRCSEARNRRAIGGESSAGGVSHKNHSIHMTPVKQIFLLDQVSMQFPAVIPAVLVEVEPFPEKKRILLLIGVVAVAEMVVGAFFSTAHR